MERGARKLLERDPLSRLVAVDEYLALVAGTHPNADWELGQALCTQFDWLE